MDLSKINLFPFFPDNAEVRGDVADYYFEVQRFDSDVAKAVAHLEKIGELENTIIVVTGDHGMPFPRCKSNLYDSGTKVPLAIRWGQKIKAGQSFKDFVSLTDLAPTFLQAAGLTAPAAMTGRSLLPALTGKGSLRKYILTGKERHVPSQESPSMEGYPSRAYRDHRYLYIRNYSPELWPNGTPLWQKATIKNTWYGDTDNGPTKSVIAELGPDSKYYQWSFSKRPTDELYDLSNDPHQLVNVATKLPELTKKYATLLTSELTASGDPRHGGPAFDFAVPTYGGGGPRYPKAR